MLNTSTRILLPVALLCLASPTSTVMAQEKENITILPGVVQRATNVHSKPSARGPLIRQLGKDTAVRILSPDPRSGFWRVILPHGRQGYVSAADVTIAEIATATAASSAACAATLEACKPQGCAADDSKKAIFNKAKNHIPTGTSSVLITFTDFRSLQRQANALVDQGVELSQEQRDSISSLTVANGKAGEGKLVKLVGFIVKDSDPHANTGETVNCNLPNQPNNDFHITLASRGGNSEFQGIVVEMIPHDRPEGWTLPKLRKAKNAGLKVMVIGGLFYDNDHVVNSNPNDNIGGEPKRFSLWEIHPITQFFVCQRAGNACSASVVSQWTPLETFH